MGTTGWLGEGIRSLQIGTEIYTHARAIVELSTRRPYFGIWNLRRWILELARHGGANSPDTSS
jgi:hypothetical protein